MNAQPSFQIRNYRSDDLAGVVALVNAQRLHHGNERTFTLDDYRVFLESPNIDQAQDVFVVLDPSGRIIGYADIDLTPGSQRVWSSIDVAFDAPDHDTIILALLHLLEARAVEKAGAELTADQGIELRLGGYATETVLLGLLQAEGYAHIRDFYEMHITYAGVQEAPPLPTGIELRPFDAEQHAYAVFEAHNDSFTEHWGYEAATWEEWKHYRLSPEMNYDVWLVAWEGDQVAGIALNRIITDKPDYGWTMTLGVRRQWRKRGLGMALLQGSFAALQAAGCTHSGLGVDASNTTNAVALYERAGMRVQSRHMTLNKQVRAGVITPDEAPITS